MAFQRFLAVALAVAVVCSSDVRAAKNMNQGGVPYEISNGPGSTEHWKGTPGKYSTNFMENVDGKVEYFDVYGEVKTVYSQVYWTRNAPIDLPPELVARFKGKVMAITGYEVDQVTHKGPQPGSTTTKDQLGGFSCYPSCDDSVDKSVPIYHAYNHHYFSWLIGEDAEMYQRKSRVPNPTMTAFRAKNSTDHKFPVSIVYKENPGGEFRKSYHGYPSGYAQLLHSPTQWIVEPMQVDTHNREYDINNDTVGYKEWFLPKQFTANNMTDLHSGMSPLIECPCTDRITKSKTELPAFATSGTCGDKQIKDEKDCKKVAAGAGINFGAVVVISDPSKPNGCFVVPSESNRGHQYKVFFNSAKGPAATCGKDGVPVALVGKANLGNLTTLAIAHDGFAPGNNVSITISGPEGSWFGVGFDAKQMADEPYALIIDGKGKVTERKLGSHAPGTLLKTQVSVEANTVANGIRTVVLVRPVLGMEYLREPGNLNVITAIGNTVDLAYHKARTGAMISLLPKTSQACICEPSVAAFLTYMGSEKNSFGYDCKAEPRSDMREKGDGTQRDGIPNAACDVKTYHGGLQCCKHKFLLTDKDQESLIPKDKEDVYFLKWRYYFQEYKPEPTPSHKHLHHWVFLIDDAVNDYEEDNLPSHYGIDMGTGVGKITAHLTVRDMGLEDIAGAMEDNGLPDYPIPFYANTTIKPLVMTPHCHAPSCIREELWNADTGEILCNMTAAYGNKRYGNLNSVFNEANYLTILPCIFGEQAGLQYPFVLSQDTNLTAIKYFNNTWRHLGQMAQWTGMMVYDTDPY
jgi:hypothetical protein